ncbi:MAG: hypothetical protein WC526_04130 [Patescibacteria group bacterium]
MPDQNQQPMVRVKKADGSFVMMKLSDLRKQNAPPQPAPKPTPKPVQPPAPIRQQPKPQPQPPKKNWTRDDASSLLEEKLGLKDNSAPTTSQTRESEVDKVVAKLDFKIPQEFKNRMRSVIQLRLKDLRSDEETRETAVRQTKDGGLGLLPAQAEKLLKACQEVELREMPTKDAPFNPFERKPAVNPVSAPKFNAPKKEEIIKKFEPSFSLSNSQPAIKPFVRDITASPIEMGPVEEIKYLTISDFRKLSDKPAESAKRLKQKLLNLQDESFLLYMDGVEAYHKSPLYLDYLNAVCESLANRRTLAATLTDKNRIQLGEIDALIEMEKEL